MLICAPQTAEQASIVQLSKCVHLRLQQKHSGQQAKLFMYGFACSKMLVKRGASFVAVVMSVCVRGMLLGKGREQDRLQCCSHV